MRMKKILTFLLTLTMVVSMLPATAFAANNTATTMRLAKTQGTVVVTNATGKKVTQTENMKLYNGYKIKTGAKSYAWFSLDDEKAVRLDANSAVKVQKNGKALTLYLSSGNIFFNVKDPLKTDESFMVRTSTMTTGIRGTSGCVRVIGPRVTEIHLLTGELEVFVEHPGLGICDYKVLKAGQKARSMIAEYSMAEVGRQAAIIIEKLGAHEVCGICAEEISRSMALQNRMILEGGFTMEEVERIVAEHDERLEHGEAVADAKQAVIDQKVDEQVFPEDVDPYFEEEEKSSGGGGSSSGGGSVTPPAEEEPETPPADGGELEEADLTRRVGSEEELLDALDEYNALAGTMEITLEGDITMDANALNELMMERNGGKAALTIDTAGNTLTLAAPIENYGKLTIADSSEDGDGNITVAGDTAIINKEGATLNMTGGAINSDYIGLINEGTATISGGTINVDGEDAIGIANSENATLDMSGGTINVNGDNAVGIFNDNSNEGNEGTVNVTGGTINVIGKEAVGINSKNHEQISLDEEEVVAEEDTAVSELTFKKATMNVSGDSSSGIYYSGKILVDDATFNVTGKSSTGIYADSLATSSINDSVFNIGDKNDPTKGHLAAGIESDGVLEMKDTDFVVLSDSAVGAYIVTSEEASLSGCTFEVSGKDAGGVYASTYEELLLDKCTFEVSGEGAIGITNRGKLLKFTAAENGRSNSSITVGAGADADTYAYGMHVNDDFMVGDILVTVDEVYDAVDKAANGENDELAALLDFLNMQVNTGGKPFYNRDVN